MQVTQIPVQKLRVSEVVNLDPVDVYLEDAAPGRGCLVVTCADQSWTHTWTSMGSGRSLADFLVACDVDYLVRAMGHGLPAERFSGTAMEILARRTVLGRRRPSLRPDKYDDEEWSASKAREIYDQVKGRFTRVGSVQECPAGLMAELFGPDDWWLSTDRASEPNPAHVHLTRVVTAVRDAVMQIKQEEFEVV